MSKKGRQLTALKYSILALACLGLFFVAGIKRVSAVDQTTLGTLAISVEQGSLTAVVSPGENNFTTSGAGSTGENSFTTTGLDEHSFTTLANPTTGCTSNCGGGGGGGGGGSGGGSGYVGQVAGAFIMPPPACSLYLREFIHLGRANNPVEVRKLQAFLDVFEGERLPITGFYSQADFAAVTRFQTKYARDILGPWGIAAPTGYVFITTRLAINNVFCHRSTANDLDLRNYYPALSFSPESKEGGSGLVSTSTASTSESVIRPNLFQLAALGLFKIFQPSPGNFLIALIILAILFMLFLIWRLSKYPDTAAPNGDDDLPPLEHLDHDTLTQAGLLLTDDGVDREDISHDDSTQPKLDRLE